MKKIICKITNKEFFDIDNKSGVITKHLKSILINVPSSSIRRKYLKQNKIPWHFQYFNISEFSINEEFFKCKYCDWKTIDLDNKSGCYTSHLKNVHNKDLENYILEFSDEEYKFKTFFDKKNKKIKTELNGNFVECKICNLKVRYLTNTHLKTHNITPEEYKIKFGIREYASINFINNSRIHLQNATKNIKKTFVSKPEKDLRDFITEDLGLKIEYNNRNYFNGIEIDIIIPDKKICFEFNGNLFHSENYGKKSRFFHLNKTEICKNKGFKLIHIMEDEWFLKNDIVKEKIKNILGLNDKPSIYARNCNIKVINSKEKNLFLNKNHIQGEDKSEIHLGAFYNEQLISVCTFSSSRLMVEIHNIETEFELKRFASDINFRVIGIFSKFIYFFKKNYHYSLIFTFLDIRWNSDEKNNVYIKNGFKLNKILKPDYTYYNSKISRYKRFHKFSFGKNSLKNKFPNIYSDSKTEWEIMQEVGYDRIWDCGKFKFII